MTSKIRKRIRGWRLTAAEKEVYKLLIEGMSVVEIALELELTMRSADGFRESIHAKRGVKKTNELIHQYYQNKLNTANSKIKELQQELISYNPQKYYRPTINKIA